MEDRNPNQKDRILLTFNTKFEEDPQKRKWKVLVNEVERLAHQIVVIAYAETVVERIPQGEERCSFLCEGRVVWKEGDVALITP